jgi:hypothetical protein
MQTILRYAFGAGRPRPALARLALLAAAGCGGSSASPRLPDGGGAPPANLSAPAAQADAGTAPLGDAPSVAVPPGGPPPDAAVAASDGFVPHPSPRSLAIFDESQVVEFTLAFPPGEWDKLLAGKGTVKPGGTQAYVRCSFAFAGETFPEAACRRKGNLDDRLVEPKPQLIVRFNFWNKDGRFRGLRRLDLEAFDGTNSPVRDRAAMWVARQVGLDAPRVNHARVVRDGSLLGLYQNIEAIDREFLEDHFGPDADGNLWEDGESGLTLKTNEAMPRPSWLTALESMVEQEPLDGDHQAFFARLPSILDVSEVLRELALETLLVTVDNYSNGSSNFYYYEHPRRGLMVLPWDLDEVITEGPADADPFEYLGDPPSKPNKLRQLMNRNPAWRAEFVNDLVAMRDGAFTRLPAQVDLYCSQVRLAVQQDPNKSYELADFEMDCELIKQRIADRRAALKRLLGR